MNISSAGAVWPPDALGPDERVGPRKIGDPVTLSKAERMWVDHKTAEETGRPRRSLSGRVHRAVEQYRRHAVDVAEALHAASVAEPPPNRSTAGMPRGSDPSDPALAQITATHDAIDRGAVWYGHLLDDCLVCADRLAVGRHNHGQDTLARLLDDDWSEIVDHLSGLSATSPFAFKSAVSRAAVAHDGGAGRFEEWMSQLHREGAEPDVLDNLASRFERLVGQMRALSDSLGQWRPGVLVRRCAAGCGGAAPPRGEGATCGRCRNRKYQANKAG